MMQKYYCFQIGTIIRDILNWMVPVDSEANHHSRPEGHDAPLCTTVLNGHFFFFRITY